MTELLKVASAWKGHTTFVVTTTEVLKGSLAGHGPVYVVGECNRKQPLKVLGVFFRCVVIVLRKRPTLVISTGAAAGCMICYLSKLLGSKIIWLDSITNVRDLSISGRMVRRIADLFLVQWPELAARYKNAEYIGTVI